MDQSTEEPRMTKAYLRQVCKLNNLYLTPELNDVLYLHYKGFTQIENLDEYTALKCLWLQNNSLSDVSQGLEHLTKLRALHLHHNNIKSMNGLLQLTALVTLNICHNNINELYGIEKLPNLQTLQASHNRLQSISSIETLNMCPVLSCLDVSYNRLSDPSVTNTMAAIPRLHVLQLNGNPCVAGIKHYRNMLTASCVQLTYLDDKPVLPVDRAAAEAWLKGGEASELSVRKAWQQRQRSEMARCVDDVIRLQERVQRRKAEQLNIKSTPTSTGGSTMIGYNQNNISNSNNENFCERIADKSQVIKENISSLEYESLSKMDKLQCSTDTADNVTSYSWNPEMEEESVDMGISVQEFGDEKIYALTPEAKKWAKERVAKLRLAAEQNLLKEDIKSDEPEIQNSCPICSNVGDIGHRCTINSTISKTKIISNDIDKFESISDIPCEENESIPVSESCEVENEDKNYNATFLNFLKSISNENSILLKQAIKNIEHDDETTALSQNDDKSSLQIESIGNTIQNTKTDMREDTIDSDIEAFIDDLDELENVDSLSDDIYIDDQNEVIDESENLELLNCELCDLDEKWEYMDNLPSIDHSKASIISVQISNISGRNLLPDSNSKTEITYENETENLNQSKNMRRNAYSDLKQRIMSSSFTHDGVLDRCLTPAFPEEIKRPESCNFKGQENTKAVFNEPNCLPDEREMLKSLCKEFVDEIRLGASKTCKGMNDENNSEDSENDDLIHEKTYSCPKQDTSLPLTSYEEINMLSKLLSSGSQENTVTADVPHLNCGHSKNLYDDGNTFGKEESRNICGVSNNTFSELNIIENNNFECEGSIHNLKLPDGSTVGNSVKNRKQPVKLAWPKTSNEDIETDENIGIEELNRKIIHEDFDSSHDYKILSRRSTISNTLEKEQTRDENIRFSAHDHCFRDISDNITSNDNYLEFENRYILNSTKENNSTSQTKLFPDIVCKNNVPNYPENKSSVSEANLICSNEAPRSVAYSNRRESKELLCLESVLQNSNSSKRLQTRKIIHKIGDSSDLEDACAIAPNKMPVPQKPDHRKPLVQELD